MTFSNKMYKKGEVELSTLLVILILLLAGFFVVLFIIMPLLRGGV